MNLKFGIIKSIDLLANWVIESDKNHSDKILDIVFEKYCLNYCDKKDTKPGSEVWYKGHQWKEYWNYQIYRSKGKELQQNNRSNKVPKNNHTCWCY